MGVRPGPQLAGRHIPMLQAVVDGVEEAVRTRYRAGAVRGSAPPLDEVHQQQHDEAPKLTFSQQPLQTKQQGLSWRHVHYCARRSAAAAGSAWHMKETVHNYITY